MRDRLGRFGRWTSTAGVAALSLLSGGCPEETRTATAPDAKGVPVASADAKADRPRNDDDGKPDPYAGTKVTPSAGSGSGPGGLFGDYADADVTGKSERGGRKGSYPSPARPSPPVSEPRPVIEKKPPPPPPPPKPKIVIPPTPKPPPQSLEELVAQLKSDDYKERMRAAAKLGAMKGEAREAVPALKAAANDRNEFVRQAAEIALRQIPH